MGSGFGCCNVGGAALRSNVPESRIPNSASRLSNSPRLQITRTPVVVPHVADGDDVILAAGVDELALADVDADVGETRLVGILEENQVAWLEVVGVDVLAAGELVLNRA